MGNLRTDLENEVKEILDWSIEVEDVKRVPSPQDLPLGEKAKTFETAVLYTDVQKSSYYGMKHHRRTVAKILNAFMNGAVRIVNDNGGKVRSFNGDSILVFFDPKLDNPCNRAVKSAMELNNFLLTILRPAMKAKKLEEDFNFGVGVSVGEILATLATKVGIRGGGNSDILWQANATNFAAKLGDAAKKDQDGKRIYVSREVYHRLGKNFKYRTVKKQGWFREYEKQVLVWEELQGFRFGGKTKTVFHTDYPMPCQ